MQQKLRDTIVEFPTAVSGQYRRALTTTKEYVSEHPWRVLAIAVAVGTVVGFLLKPRR